MLPRAIVFGVYDRHVQKVKKKLKELVDVVEVISPEERRNFREKPDADLIIVLRRLSSNDNFKDVAVGKKYLTVVECETENYAEDALKKAGFLKKQEVKTTHTNPPVVKAPVEEPEETKIGLTADDLWEKYGKSSIEFVESMINEGERVDEEVLISSMADLIGLPQDDCKQLLPQLAAKGYIVNTVGSTWKRPSKGGEYEFDEDTVEAPKPKKVISVMVGLIEKVKGLKEGPYSSLYAISKCMTEYKDFSRKDGQPAGATYRLKIAENAFAMNIVEERNGEFFIKTDPSVVLEPAEVEQVEEPVQDKKAVVQTRVPELDNLSKYVPLSQIKAPEPAPKPEASTAPKKLDLSVPEQAKSAIKIDTASLMPGQIGLIRSLMPTRNWEESAVRSIQKKLVKIGSPLKSLPRNLFTDEEWDSLAWETISALPMGVVAVSFREIYEDRPCSCVECGNPFVFTKGEQEHYFRIFNGEVTPPRRCPACRKNKNEMGQNAQERVLRRYGG